MLTAKMTSRIKLPDLNLSAELKTIAQKIVIPDIYKGIIAQKAIDGSKLKDNKPKTKARKRGGISKSLIDTRTLIKSFVYKSAGKNKVIVYIKKIRSEIGGYLMDKGYLFWGVSKDASKKAISYMEKQIQRKIDAAAR